MLTLAAFNLASLAAAFGIGLVTAFWIARARKKN